MIVPSRDGLLVPGRDGLQPNSDGLLLATS